ncbi:hypothetical protein QQS21_002842 [Conoideocrella luteorostrata]|uniref:Heterokaryon incompatibility domain-containing protein n=1 Tax=Conoideocrella luteorostrata TaxID=1105319 RepID=A0AAJ0G2P2_9HYPO|nr:hypothetical protein QQS21_002842 [Conoideocrella luteorostrata]
MRPYYFRSGEYFLHFTELCLFSYPSPLEEHAPLLPKLFLLALAGGVEYVVVSILTDVLGTLTWLLGWFVGKDRRDTLPDRYRDVLLAGFFLLSFAYRTRRSLGWPILSAGYTRRAPALLRRIAVRFFWMNPALVCHCALLLWSYGTGRPRIRILTPRYFWVLIAPSLEFGEVHLEAVGKNKHNSFWSIVWYSTGIALLNVLVKTGPSVVISLALVAQSEAYRPLSHTTSSGEPANQASLWTKLDASPIFYGLRVCMEAFELAASVALSGITRVGIVYYGGILDFIAARRALPSGKHDLYIDEVQSGARHFRLLTILPGTGDRPIRCSLRCHFIADELPYTAVSYCWGRTGADHEITVNGQRLPVTRSAFEVLHALRSCYRTRTVWIDYICINQAIEGDKTNQLPLMPRIYENASEVVVWLGRSKTARLATALVDRMFLVGRLRRAGGHIKLPEYQIPVGGARALKRMLKTSWFTRVWVVQEVVRARRNVVIRYGDARLSWERFSWFTQSLQFDAAQLAMLSGRIGYSGLNNVVALQNVSMIRRFGLVKDEQLSLMFYLASIYRSLTMFDATNPHDRIYSLGGLSGRSSINLMPDYTIPLRQLFINVVKNALATTAPRHQLAFLTHAGTGYKPRVAGLPSWAPDWTVRARSEPFIGTEGGSELLVSSALKPVMDDAIALATFGQEDDAEHRGQRIQAARSRVGLVGEQMRRLLYDATPSTDACAVLRPDDTLELKGRRLDHVISLSKEFPLGGNTSERMTVLAEWTDLIIQHYHRSSPAQQAAAASPGDLAKLFFTILHQDRYDSRLDYTFSQMPKGLHEAYPAGAPLAMWEFVRHGLFNKPALAVPAHVQEVYRALAERFQRTCGGRRLGVTSKGHFGLFLPSTEAGDWVCLFSGARLPFGIRPVRGRGSNSGGRDPPWELVGPVYLRGFMQGMVGVPNLWNETIHLI